MSFKIRLEYLDEDSIKETTYKSFFREKKHFEQRHQLGCHFIYMVIFKS